MSIRPSCSSCLNGPPRWSSAIRLIADAVVQPGGIVVITAKSYGTTNLVALDRSGATLMDQPVHVTAPNDVVVVVYRGVDEESYSCAANCERRLTIGDAPTSLIPNLQALGAYNACGLRRRSEEMTLPWLAARKSGPRCCLRSAATVRQRPLLERKPRGRSCRGGAW